MSHAATTRIAAAVLFAAAAPAAAAPFDLPGDRGQALVFFVPGPSSPNLVDQMRRLEPYGTALAREDLVPVAVIGADRAIRVDTGAPLPQGTAARLRDLFDVDVEAAFAGFLVDERGTIIWQDNAPVAMSEIIAATRDRW